MQPDSLLAWFILPDFVFGALWAAILLGVLVGLVALLRKGRLGRGAGALLAVGAVVLFTGIGDRSIWADEDQQAHSATRCDRYDVLLPHCLSTGAAEAQHPPGNYHIERLSLRLFGITPLAARLPSALAGLLGALSLYALLALWTSRILLSLAGGLAFFAHPFLWYYAREGRPHIFAASFGVLVILATFTYFSAERLRPAFAWLLASVLALLLSCGLQPPIFLLAWCGTVAIFGARLFPSFRRRAIGFVAACAAGILALLPYALWGMETAKHFGWTKAPDFSFLLGQAAPEGNSVLGLFFGPYGAALAALLAAGLLVAAARGRPGPKALAFFALSFFAAAYYVLERALFQGLFAHYFFPRYAIAVIPCGIALLALAADALGDAAAGLLRRPAAGAALAIALASGVAAVMAASPRDEGTIDGEKMEWRLLYDDLFQHSEGADRFAYFDLQFIPADSAPMSSDFYYAGAHERARVYGFWTEHPPLAWQFTTALHGPGAAFFAFDLTVNPPAKAYFASHVAGDEQLLRRTYALVKFLPSPSRAARVRDLLLALAAVQERAATADRLRSLAAQAAR